MTNVLFEKSPFLQFDKISIDDLRDAFDTAYAQTNQDIDDLLAIEDEPTFENSILPLDTVLKNFENVGWIVGLYEYNRSNDDILDLAEEIEKRYDDLLKRIYQNASFARRVKGVIDGLNTTDFDAEDHHLIKIVKRGFEGDGSFLGDVQKQRLSEIDQSLITLAKKFVENCKQSQKQQAFPVTDEEELDGLPNDLISGMRQNAKDAGHDEGWLFIPERLLVDNTLSVAKSRNFRRKMHEAMADIGRIEPYSNEDVIRDMHALREERAHLVGYENHTDYHLTATMAENRGNVDHLLTKSERLLSAAFQKDLNVLQDWVRSIGGPEDMEPWDLEFYTAVYKKAHFNFDGEEFSKYMELENVLSGWIYHVEKSFGLTFQSRNDIPTWCDDVRAFTVKNINTGEESIFYIDLFARPDEKVGGAWMSPIQYADNDRGVLNAVAFNMNLVKPSQPDEPVLLGVEDVKTFFHEGGHCLHGLLGQNVKYHLGRGVRGSSDFYEIHSMIQENWAFQRDVLDNYALHCETNEPVPDSLVGAMEKSSGFMASATWLRTVQNAIWDIGFHTLSHGDYDDTDAVQKQYKIDCEGVELVRPYPLNRFDHIFADGMSSYASGYYGYFWAEVSASSAFEKLFGGGQDVYDEGRLKKLGHYYSKGGALNPETLYGELCGEKSGDPKAKLELIGIDVVVGVSSQGIQTKPVP